MSTEEQIFLTEELIVDVIKLQNNFLAINNWQLLSNLQKFEQKKYSNFIEKFSSLVQRRDEDGNRYKIDLTIPVFYRTPDDLLIDLRLYDKGSTKF